MEVKLVRSGASTLDADAVVVLEWEGSRRPEFEKPLAALYASGEIKGKLLEFTLLQCDRAPALSPGKALCPPGQRVDPRRLVCCS